MKAITIIQPWASLIALGEKQYETRSWATNYRGPIAIHAGRLTNDAIEACLDIGEMIPGMFGRLGIKVVNDLPFGAIVAFARLVECHPTKARRDQVSQHEQLLGDWSYGRFAWELRIADVLAQPIPMKGKQGLWDMPEHESDDDSASRIACETMSWIEDQDRNS